MTTTDHVPRTTAAPASRDDRHVAGRLARDERRPVVVAFIASVAAAVPTAVIAGLVAGRPGVFGALVGAALVLVLFGVGAAMMMWAGRRGQSMMAMVAAGGVAGRLVLYAAVLIALDGTALVHRPSLAVATAVTLVITLAGELAVLARTPSLFQLTVPKVHQEQGHQEQRRQETRSATRDADPERPVGTGRKE